MNQCKTGRRVKIGLSAFRSNKRHNGDRARAFDRNGQFSLMTRAITRNSSGHNFATFGNKIIEDDRVFIINFNIGVRAETAEFLSMEKFFLRRT